MEVGGCRTEDAIGLDTLTPKLLNACSQLIPQARESAYAAWNVVIGQIVYPAHMAVQVIVVASPATTYALSE